MSATQPIIADFEFVNDLRRAFSKANLPRPTAQILTEKFMESLPPDVRHDKVKLNEAMGEAINAIKQELNGLSPEDCLVYFDLISVQHLSAGNISSHSAVKEHKELLNGKVSAGLHTLPSILGRGENSTAASTEAMAYLRAVEGEQEKLNASFSYLLTMATRLMGHDVYVDFIYADPELRPKSELAAFKSMKQSLTLELLSFGFISDEEASITMTGSLPSGNFEPLSGTRFRDNKPAEAEDNVWSLTDAERRALGYGSLPASLDHALEYMEESEFVAETLGEQVFNYVLLNKRREWQEYRAQVTPFELQKNLEML
jgi:hypothetical protein